MIVFDKSRYPYRAIRRSPDGEQLICQRTFVPVEKYELKCPWCDAGFSNWDPVHSLRIDYHKYYTWIGNSWACPDCVGDY